MKKTSRSTNFGAKGSSQSSMNPYHKMRCGYASGGSVPGSDVSNATNGQSKKTNTPGEEVFRGKAIAKGLAKGGDVPKKAFGGMQKIEPAVWGPGNSSWEKRNKLPAAAITPVKKGGKIPKRGMGGILGDLLGIIGLAEGGMPKSRCKGGKWIQKAINPSNKGKLHRELGVPEGQKIPAKKLMKAEHSSNPKLAKQARLAQTLKSFHNRKI